MAPSASGSSLPVITCPPCATEWSGKYASNSSGRAVGGAHPRVHREQRPAPGLQRVLGRREVGAAGVGAALRAVPGASTSSSSKRSPDEAVLVGVHDGAVGPPELHPHHVGVGAEVGDGPVEGDDRGRVEVGEPVAGGGRHDRRGDERVVERASRTDSSWPKPRSTSTAPTPSTTRATMPPTANWSTAPATERSACRMVVRPLARWPPRPGGLRALHAVPEPRGLVVVVPMSDCGETPPAPTIPGFAPQRSGPGRKVPDAAQVPAPRSWSPTPGRRCAISSSPTSSTTSRTAAPRRST